MNCMKCGRETRDDNVFCRDCLRDMQAYPVRPGTVVLLPRRKESFVPKKITKRHVPTAEEQLVKLRKWLTILTILLAVCIVAIGFMIKPTLHYALDEHVAIGQNYSSVVTTVPQTSASTAD